MNAASKDIATLLSQQSGLGLEFPDSVNDVEGNLFYSRLPDQPDDCVAVLDNPGDPPMLLQEKAANNYYYSSISIQVRNTSYDDGWAVIIGIVEFLHGHSREEIASTYYTLIRALNDPQVLMYDENERITFMVNFEVQRRSI